MMKRPIAAALACVLVTVSAGRAAKEDPAKDKRTTGELIRALGGELPYERLRASKALGARGPKVLPAVLKALKAKDWKVRRGAADALGAMGADAKAAVPDLAKALKDKDAWVRAGAAAALGRVGPLPAESAKALAGLAADPDSWVREEAVNSLRSATKDKAILLPAAIAAVKVRDSGWGVRRHAMSILWQHGRAHKPAAPALIEMLKHPSEGMWDSSGRAVEMLVGLGEGAKAAPIVAKWLTSKNRGMTRRAAGCLATIGAAAASAIPALKAVAETDKDKGNREAAKKAIEQIEAAGKKK